MPSLGRSEVHIEVSWAAVKVQIDRLEEESYRFSGKDSL